MKFIFPQNYKFSFKILGLLDYPTAILNVIYALLIFFINKLLFSSLTIKIIFFIIFYFPFLLFSIIGINGENLLITIYYLLKYFFKRKLLFYNKDIIK